LERICITAKLARTYSGEKVLAVMVGHIAANDSRLDFSRLFT